MNIEEDYVSYEVAKLLKEKGFNEICFRLIREDAEIVEAPSKAWNGMTKKQRADFYLCPTHQMACKWLRENHKLLISVDATPIYGKMKDDKGRNTCGILYWNYIASGEWTNEKYNPIQKAFAVSGKSYEQALENALKYALEKQGEQKPQRMISAEAKEAMYDKFAWSEDDEEFLSEIISDIKFAQDKHPDSQMNQIIFEEEVTWLKSLKGRIGG